MATDKPTPAISAHVVGNAFVEQYYHVLHLNPEMACRFYQENSVLSRPNHDGFMINATTLKSINDVICSLDYKNYKAEIKTADAQYSYHDGVVLLVTGSLTGTDHQTRKFTQTFFLAPQDTGYFVLNDIFRYVDDSKAEAASGLDVGIDSRKPITPTADPEPSPEVNPPQSDLPKPAIKDIEVSGEKDDGGIVDEKTSSLEKDIVLEPESHSNLNHVPVDSEAVNSASEENTPKKSYASIVSSQTKKGPTKVYVPTSSARVAQKVENQPPIQAAEVSTSEASLHPTAAPATESHGNLKEDEGHSIYIRNMPLNATVSQLEAEFTKFGPIKPDGIQVRNNRAQGLCFGFVEFRELSSMQNAIKASPITIGGRQAVVEPKRATSRVTGGRNRFTPTRGGFRNDNFRGRGNLGGGGRAYARVDTSFRDQGSYTGGGTGDTFHQSRERGSKHPPAPDSNLVAN